MERPNGTVPTNSVPIMTFVHQDSSTIDDEEDEKNSSEVMIKIESSGMYHTIFNFVNSIIGSGVIGIPYALYQSGLGLGIILLVLVAVITDYSLRILVISAIKSNAYTYPKVAEAAFGKPGRYVLTILQFIFPFMAMTSYNVIIADNLPQILITIFQQPSDSWLKSRSFSLFLATVFINLPLSLLRKITRLSKISFISLFLVAILELIIVYRAFQLDIPATPNAYAFYNVRFVQASGVMALTFMCHHNIFLLYAALRNASLERWMKATHASVTVSWVIVVVIGISGYLSFTGYSQGDILVNYCPGDITANLARALFIITIMLTYPIQCFVTREIVENALFTTSTLIKQYTVTVVLVFFIFVISCLTKCLKVFLEINGVFVAVPLAYIIPSILFIKLDESPYLSAKKFPAFVLVILGFSLTIVGAVHIIMELVEGVDCVEGVNLPYCSSSFNSTAKSRV